MSARRYRRKHPTVPRYGKSLGRMRRPQSRGLLETKRAMDSVTMETKTTGRAWDIIYVQGGKIACADRYGTREERKYNGGSEWGDRKMQIRTQTGCLSSAPWAFDMCWVGPSRPT